jgi:predicted NUDIX family NTP pyrophosphohydrolase
LSWASRTFILILSLKFFVQIKFLLLVMPKKISAGLLMYRTINGLLEVFLVHPGGPYFKNKDEGVWTIPKGETENTESLLETAIREFREETGIDPGAGYFIPLESIKQKGGKIVHTWAFEGDWDETIPIKSNYFELEWPPRSGNKQKYPEIDRADFFTVDIAKQKINSAQIDLLVKLERKLKL